MAISSYMYVETDNLVSITDLVNAETDAAISDAVIKATLCEQSLVHPIGVAVTAGAGLHTALPVEAHGKVIGEHVLIFGTENFDGVHHVMAGTTTDVLVIDVAFAAETFDGLEEIYAVVAGAVEIELAAGVTAGSYYGTLPSTMLLHAGYSYYLFYVLTVSGTTVVKRVEYKADYL